MAGEDRSDRRRVECVGEVWDDGADGTDEEDDEREARLTDLR